MVLKMRLKGLMEPLINSKEFSSISLYIQRGETPIEVEGLSESAKAY